MNIEHLNTSIIRVLETVIRLFFTFEHTDIQINNAFL